MSMNRSVRSTIAEVPVAPVVDTTLDDPSDPRIAAVAPVAPVAEPVAEPTPELRYEYQPKDEQGRPLGGKQVIVYTDMADLQAKWAAKEEQLVRKLREVTRKQTLGISDETEIPADAARFDEFVELQPRELTAEERFNLSQDLNDPSKAVEAINTLISANLGATPDEMRKLYNKQQLSLAQMQAKAYYDFFEKQCTDFYPCTENKQVLTDWMVKKGLAPTVKNFNLAFSTLKGAGLLLDSPIVREVTPARAPVVPPPAPASSSTEPKPQVPVATESRITPEEQPQAKRQARVPSGLNSSISSDSITSGPTTTLTLADVDSMTSEEYKKQLRNPAFAKMVNELYSASAKRNARNV